MGMYKINGYCDIHGKYTAPVDDASCPECDNSDEEICTRYDSENRQHAINGSAE